MKSIKINNIIIISRTIVVTVLVCLPTLSRANDVSSYLSDNYVNDSLSGLCKDAILSLNFANTNIDINSDFISSPFITCLNLTGNHINFALDAFRELPNLTTLFLSKLKCNSGIHLDGHEKLKVFLMNDCKSNSPDDYSSRYYPSRYGYSDYSNVRSKQTVYINGNYQDLEILSLRNNNIENLRYSTTRFTIVSSSSNSSITPNVQNIPFPKLRILDLSKNVINNSTFVDLLPIHSLSFLDLCENSLESLKLNKKGENVHTLILDSNKIEYVAWQSAKSSLDLIGMTSLTYLSLFNNRINDIQSNAFKDTNRLEFLNLSKNAIETLYQYTFANLNYLQTLDLSFNQIKNITTQLSNEINISTLLLNYNKMNKITLNAFIQFPQLKKLYLENNDIEWIDTKAFSQLSMLEELSLSNNKLSFLPEGWSESLISLNYLNLNKNKFTSLDSLSLTNKIPLTQLYFMNNSLKYLSNEIFKQYITYLPQNLHPITLKILDYLLKTADILPKSIKNNNITIIGTIAVLLCFFTLLKANDVSPYLWRSYVNNSSDDCENNIISLNFAHTIINSIGDDFISSSLITCLNLTDNHITYLADNAFRKLPNLTTLFLSYNNVKSNIHLSGHENLKVLIMDSYKSYENYYKSFEQRIDGKYQNLEILSLSENYIRDLVYSPYESDNMYKLSSQNLMSLRLDITFPNLKFLDLSRNRIQTTKFVNLLPRNGLSFLDLHENSLQSLHLYKKGEDVCTLILDNNEIKYLTWQSGNQWSLDLFSMKSLRILSISMNSITDIQSDAFQDTNKLEFLNLSGNAIETLHKYTFANLKYLQTVDLSFNLIKNIPHFANELNISTLFLHHNKITTIRPNVFIQFLKLKKLFLEGNDIEWIDTNAFSQLPMLEKLNLSNNKLSSLPEGWSESLISLKYLNLCKNNFTSLELLSLSSTISLRDLYLMKNPLKYLNISYFEYLPQNLTVHLLD
ncbi:protein artichoke-like [Pseudomyrmex gracilis]|uniref:protein artichoke-like n=1 Tax=Pseudomyrmex gracilis TaxID=219809 RepID=UPI0009950218|nr:protein artichoke-like [Pseudomyrmex gracilis]